MINPIITEKPGFKVIGMSREIDTTNCMTEIPKFWAWFYANGYNKYVCGQFGICHSYNCDNGKFKYSIADNYAVDAKAPEGFEVITIPACAWAVFKCVGAMPGAIQKMWTRIDLEWLPNSGYEKICGFDIEAYTPRDLQSPDYESAIWIPVKKK